MIVESSITRQCRVNCKDYNEGYCQYRISALETKSDFNWRMMRMRDDKSYERITYKKDGSIKYERIINTFKRSLGRCSKQEIELLVRSNGRKRMKAGDVL